MTADDLAGRIVVRHRESGHVRFELPVQVCHAEAAVAVEGGLRELAGVYRVTFDTASRRLSIRFEPRECSLGDVARRLKSLLGDLPAASSTPAPSPAPADAAIHSDGEALAQRWSLHDIGARARGLADQAATRLRGAVTALREPAATEGSLTAKLQPLVASALSEKAIINFLNDLVAFYLIKAHWDLISRHWLKDPLKFRNAWLTTFYLVFLLVRYRKQAAKP